MNPSIDISLPWTAPGSGAGNGGSCGLPDTGCGCTCLFGTGGSLPTPGPNVTYCVGSVTASSTVVCSTPVYPGVP